MWFCYNNIVFFAEFVEMKCVTVVWRRNEYWKRTHSWIRCVPQREMLQVRDRIGPRQVFYHTHCCDRVDFSGNKYTVHIVFHRSTLIGHRCSRIWPLRSTSMCIPTWGRTLYHPNMIHLRSQWLSFLLPSIVRHHPLMWSLPIHFDQLAQPNDLIARQPRENIKHSEN